MRLVHLSDLHLGFRQFQRQTPAGINQREADVAATCSRAIDQVIALAPDVVLVAGDVFHHVRPSNTAILDGVGLFARLRAALPDALIVMIAGNHDVPRTTDSGCILQLFTQFGVRVVFRGAERIDDAARDLSILAIPYAPPTAGAATEPGERPILDRDAKRRFNVLLMHDEVRGVVPAAAQPGDRLYTPIDPLELEAAPWDYVALGHYHVYRKVSLRHASTGREVPCYYSGSVDYTSTNPWTDLKEEARPADSATGGKGFVEHDLETGEHRFHRVPVSRQLLDVPPIAAAGLPVDTLNARIADALALVDGTLDDSIVRLVLKDVTRHVVRTLDYTALRDVRRRTLHFHLDARKPEGRSQPHSSERAPRRATLRDRLSSRLAASDLAPGLDRTRLVELGLTYLSRAEEAAADALPVADG